MPDGILGALIWLLPRIDDGERDTQPLDVVVHLLFLIPQAHHVADWTDGGESAGNEALHFGCFDRVSEFELLELVGRADRADEDVDARQSID